MTDVSTNTRPPFFPQTHRTRHQGQLQNLQQEQGQVQNAPIESLTREQIQGTDIPSAAPVTINQDTKVDIPVSIKDFAQIKKVADQAKPLDRSEKIAALKDQIQRGEYKINESAIADKMLEQEF